MPTALSQASMSRQAVSSPSVQGRPRRALYRHSAYLSSNCLFENSPSMLTVPPVSLSLVSGAGATAGLVS